MIHESKFIFFINRHKSTQAQLLFLFRITNRISNKKKLQVVRQLRITIIWEIKKL